jgi:glutamate mutase epsilon subunit
MRKALLVIVAVVVLCVGFLTGAKAYGSYDVTITTVSPSHAGGIPNEHVLGFSCVSEVTAIASQSYSETKCYVLTAGH